MLGLPIGPCGPVGPCAPCPPVGPRSVPGAPVGPCTPWFPIGPVAPGESRLHHARPAAVDTHKDLALAPRAAGNGHLIRVHRDGATVDFETRARNKGFSFLHRASAQCQEHNNGPSSMHCHASRKESFCLRIRTCHKIAQARFIIRRRSAVDGEQLRLRPSEQRKRDNRS